MFDTEDNSKLIESLNTLNITLQKVRIDGTYLFTEDDVENAEKFIRTFNEAA
ncbi:MAG: hypothetical protein WC866_04645 [Patescibacteria group bacterium]|jgi:hypothetical protein